MKNKLFFLFAFFIVLAFENVSAQDYYREYKQQHHKRNNRKAPQKKIQKQNTYHYNDYYEQITVYAMDDYRFYEALETIKDEPFAQTQMELAVFIVNNNWLTTQQIILIIDEFYFEENRLSFAKMAYIKCVDPENYIRVFNTFYFSSSKEELSQFISTY